VTELLDQPLDWTHRTVDVPKGGLARTRAVTDDERTAIIALIGLLSLERLEARYRIEAIAGNAYKLTGRVSAAVEQACIISLEPVADTVDADFDVEFWPDIKTADNDEDASVLGGPDIEPLERGIIPVGRIVYESFAAALDPYPRRPDAEFNWQDPKAPAPEKASPFAALSKLKDKG
jgi:uncharacterized metal-binding protein YceD (DUF177 family)